MEEPMTAMNRVITTMQDRLRTGMSHGHLTLVNKVSHIGVGLLVQPLAITGNQRRELQLDCSLDDLSFVEEVAGTMDRAAGGLVEADRRFGADLPSWAIGVHPVMRMGLGRSGHGIETLADAHRAQQAVPDEHEEILVTHRPGVHLEVRLLRINPLLRARHTFATIDVPHLPETIRTRLPGTRLGDLVQTGDAAVDDCIIREAIDRGDVDIVRIGFHADLVPIVTPPDGEDPWWIGAWSVWLAMQRRATSTKD